MERIAEAVNILMVEDSEGDARLTEEALKDSKLRIRLDTVVDGVEALEYLRKRGRYAQASTPDLILLDLNLPRVGGMEVLQEVKADQALRDIPVVVMTSSRAEQDILRSYKLQASCYITKPIDLEQFSNIVRSIDQFWFTIVTLPPKIPA